MASTGNEIDTLLGAVLFLDIDAYLLRAKRLSTDEELLLSTSLRRSVVSIAQKNNLQLLRSFGDGFLLILHGAIDEKMLERATRFLVDLRAQFAKEGFTFKASLVAGPFALAQGDGPNDRESILVGPAANYAGKLLRQAKKGEILLAWPIRRATVSRTSSLNDLISQLPAIELNLDSLKPGIRMIPNAQTLANAPIVEAGPMESPTLYLSEQIKLYMGEMIKLADDKAKFALTIAAGLLAYLFNQRIPDIIGGKLRTSIVELVASAMLITSTSLLFATFVFGALVILPRTGSAHRGFIFFGSIAKWGAGESYWRNLQALRSDELARETALHNYEYACVAERKYFHLRRSILSMFAGLVCISIYFLIWDGWMKL